MDGSTALSEAQATRFCIQIDLIYLNLQEYFVADILPPLWQPFHWINSSEV